MALNASQSKNTVGKVIPPIEPGSYPARLVVLADLGLQPQNPYQGQEKPPVYEILTVYEFLDEFLKDDDGEDDLTKPRWQSESFALFPLQSERAKSTKRYLALDPTGVYSGDWTKLLNTPCIVTVVNTPGKGKNVGRVYTNIAGVSAMRPKDAAKAVPLVNKQVIFDLDNPSVDAFVALPAWIQKRIREGLEFKGSKAEEVLKDIKTENKPQKDDEVHTETEDDDEIPF